MYSVYGFVVCMLVQMQHSLICSSFQVQLRDYPQQFHETTDFTVTGCIIIAEPLPNENGVCLYCVCFMFLYKSPSYPVIALLREELFIEDPWENVEVTRTLTPLKIYYDLDLGQFFCTLSLVSCSCVCVCVRVSNM